MKRATTTGKSGPAAGKKEHSQLRQGPTRKNGCGKQTAGSSFRKGRSHVTVEGRNEDPGRGLGQDEVQDKDQDEDKFEQASKVADGLGNESQSGFRKLQRVR